jgi:NADH dehydrogenase
VHALNQSRSLQTSPIAAVFVWAGGVKAPELVADSGLPTGHNGRVKVDRYLRVLDHPEIYAAG